MRLRRIIAATVMVGAAVWVPAATASAAPAPFKDTCKNGGWMFLHDTQGNGFAARGSV
jgi:hypothetical protein